MKLLDLTLFASAASATALPRNAAISPAVRWLGRVNPATQELTWPGTGLAFTFTGTTATISLKAVSGSNSADLVVDGKKTTISNVQGTSITTPAGLARGNHSVVFRHRSEAGMGTITINDVTSDGVLSKSAVPKRQIEIIGDSISVGYGLDGTLPCTNTAALQDAPLTYGALAAESLSADYSIVAWSGKGITRNYPSGGVDTSPLMPELYTRYGANDADNSYTYPASWNPQAIVINLGTNDFAYQGQRDPLNATTYTNAMVAFVKTIKSHYPNAYFFLLNSPMLSDTYPTAADAQKTTQTNALKAAISQLNGTKIQLVDWPTQGSDVGCDYHPNAATHAAEAKVLAAAIKTALSW